MEKYKLSKKEYRLTISDHILDNVYGQIGLTELERKIERLPLFKRLHSVSQLGLVNWVFPCALHTRYTHSIGVMHVAGQMAEHINANKGYAFFSDAEIQIIRLAGMLHDIGHYPLSHNVEQVYKDIGSDQKVRQLATETVNKHLENYINCPDFLNPSMRSAGSKSAEQLRNKFCKSFSGSKGYHHEAIGQALITHNALLFEVVKKYFVLMPDTDTGDSVFNGFFSKNKGRNKTTYSENEVDKITHDLLTMIGNIVIGNYAYEDTYHNWTNKYSAMVQLIHSDLDADNLDYLLRDASFSGTSYGLMDMSVLMNCLTVTDLNYEDATVPGKTEHRYIVGVKKKGIGCVDQFLINKYLAYSQMTFSKYVSILEAMLTQIARAWLKLDRDYKPEELESMVNKPETSENYLLFTDSLILRRIFEKQYEGDLLLALPRHIISYLKNYSAFNLLKTETGESECICIGMTEEEIVKIMQQSDVYKRFLKMSNKIGAVLGKELNEDGRTSLFSFRFERYALTKQLPLKEFNKKYDMEEGVKDAKLKFDIYYYRIGSGIPVIEEKAYGAKYDGKKIDCCMPDLSVDCKQSTLHDIYSMQFVSLREYKVDDYAYLA